MNSKKLIAFFALAFYGIVFFSYSPAILFAEDLVDLSKVEYELLEDLPLGSGGANVDKVNVGDYLQGVVKLVIGLAGVAAVIMIIVGGFKYISAEGFGQKSDAKETITNALVGLLLTIGSFAILSTVNPNLLSFDLTVKPIKPADTVTQTPPATPPPGTTGECAGCVYVTSADFPQKPPGSGCKTTLPQRKCQVVASLVPKLKALTVYMREAGVGWQVSEMYPPVVQHSSACHYNGTCIDATLTSAKTAANIAIFIEEFLTNVTSNLIYEVPTDARLQQLRNDPALANYRQYIVKTGAPEHLHTK